MGNTNKMHYFYDLLMSNDKKFTTFKNSSCFQNHQTAC